MPAIIKHSRFNLWKSQSLLATWTKISLMRIGFQKWVEAITRVTIPQTQTHLLRQSKFTSHKSIKGQALTIYQTWAVVNLMNSQIWMRRYIMEKGNRGIFLKILSLGIRSSSRICLRVEFFQERRKAFAHPNHKTLQINLSIKLNHPRSKKLRPKTL